MKLLKLFTMAIAFLATASLYSQWTYCPGSINMSGLGSFPFISVVDQNTAFVCGGTGGQPRVYRTTNGGANFVNITGTLTGPEFYAVWGIDANTVLVGDGGAIGGTGGNAKIWRTSDGGVTWTTVLTTGGTLGFFNGIVGLASNRNFLFTQSDGSSTQLWATSTNGGVTWTTGTLSAGGATGAAGSLWISTNQIFGHGISGSVQVAVTTNGGATWTARVPGLTGNFTSGFAMNDAGSILIAASSTSLPNIGRSTNGGTSWTTVNTGAGLSGLCVLKWIPGTNAGYLSAATGANGIKRSVDGGATWTSMTTASITGFNDMAFVFTGGVVYGYAIAADGSVIKVADNSLTGVDPTNTNTPTEFVLKQNYPNPFNPETVIKFSIPKATRVTLKVYNSIGKEVMTVTDKEYAVGNYIENVNMDGFSSGIYFYTLTAGDFKETKKMMLVK